MHPARRHPDNTSHLLLHCSFFFFFHSQYPLFPSSETWRACRLAERGMGSSRASDAARASLGSRDPPSRTGPRPKIRGEGRRGKQSDDAPRAITGPPFRVSCATESAPPLPNPIPAPHDSASKREEQHFRETLWAFEVSSFYVAFWLFHQWHRCDASFPSSLFLNRIEHGIKKQDTEKKEKLKI